MAIRNSIALLASLALASCTPTPMQPALGAPSPVLYLKGMEAYSTGGKDWIRYKYDVLNKTQYPAELFDPAPSLPPCGLNTSSSRTWVRFYDEAGNPIYGFCALGSPDQLADIWVAFEEGVVPPSWIYIELIDRQTNTVYKSNLADTVL
jgi:hypothetical protein